MRRPGPERIDFILPFMLPPLAWISVSSEEGIEKMEEHVATAERALAELEAARQKLSQLPESPGIAEELQLNERKAANIRAALYWARSRLEHARATATPARSTSRE